MDNNVLCDRTKAALTVICLTEGGSTLARALRSLRRQSWDHDDRVLLVHRGSNKVASERMWKDAALPGRILVWDEKTAAEIVGYLAAMGGHALVLKESDALAPPALSLIRSVTAGNPDSLFLFRASLPDGSAPWNKPEICKTDVSVPQLVFPADSSFDKAALWEGDGVRFVETLLRNHSDRPVIWRKEAPQIIGPHERWIRPGWVDGSAHARETGREDCQSGWQTYFGTRFRGEQILDVGAGLGESKQRLSAGGNHVTTFDVASGLPVDFTGDLSVFSDRAFDVVTAFDVVEHIPDPRRFLADLQRLASRAIVLTTPNVWVSRCRNPHHVREYSPPAFLDLLCECEEFQCVDCLVSANYSGTGAVSLRPEEFLGTVYPVMAAVLQRRTER